MEPLESVQHYKPVEQSKREVIVTKLTNTGLEDYRHPWDEQQKEIARNGPQQFLCCFAYPGQNISSVFCWWKARKVSATISEQEEINDQADLKNSLRSRDVDQGLKSEARPTNEQVDKWKTGIESLLDDKLGRLLFGMFLRRECSDENLKFWVAAEMLRDPNRDLDSRKQLRIKIYEVYIKERCKSEINISAQCRRMIEEKLSAGTGDHSSGIYEKAQQEVLDLMKRQGYPRFLRSDFLQAYMDGNVAFVKDAVDYLVAECDDASINNPGENWSTSYTRSKKDMMHALLKENKSGGAALVSRSPGSD